MEQPMAGRFSTVDSAPSHWPGGRSAGKQEKPRRPPPLLGEHTLEIMAELGYDAEAIEQACRSGSVAFLPH
jgi:crotonobetainyl-CoA:carnitine CoA-transferase CaiB-like acyl-CoA transferase